MRRVLFLLLLASPPATALAQSSQFGVRGLGLPGRWLSARAAASGGAFGLFDPESSQNPAALGIVPNLTSVFTIDQAYGHRENPAGTASTRDSRFPLLSIAGPVRRNTAALGLSYSNYTDRDFTIETRSVQDLRDVPVSVTDSFSSRGGLSDLRAAGAYRIPNRWLLGVGLHAITGSNRLESRRSFADSAYLTSVQRAEVSYSGVGISVGLIRQFGNQFAVAAMARSDGHVNVDRDSARVGTVDLPYTFGFGFRWQLAPRLQWGAQGIVRTWSAANSDLLQQGGIGAENTYEVAAGAEYTPDLKRPSQRPLRFGAYYATLPFPVVPGEQGHELGMSAGSGIRFAQQRAGIDLSLEHVWRSEGVYRERTFLISIGMSVRP